MEVLSETVNLPNELQINMLEIQLYLYFKYLVILGDLILKHVVEICLFVALDAFITTLSLTSIGHFTG